MMSNFAEVGGAIHATEGNLYITGNTIVMNNTATRTGGGIKIYTNVLYTVNIVAYLRFYTMKQVRKVELSMQSVHF